jgi:hypothetical protein
MALELALYSRVDLNKWQVLAAATALLDVENGGAVQSDRFGAVTGPAASGPTVRRSGHDALPSSTLLDIPGDLIMRGPVAERNLT